MNLPPQLPLAIFWARFHAVRSLRRPATVLCVHGPEHGEATITGPAEANYQVPALDAGDYKFQCSVHPNMTGTLTAG